jgi:DNA-binding PadR family transcriptional regulator
MSLDQKAQILEAAASTTCGVRDLVQVLEWKTSKVISLLREMNKERLIDLQQVSYSRRGRPKKNIICTPLGFEFLETYRKLKMKPLRARKEDLERAVKDASYTNRLIANGHSPFQIFMELNTIARNIKVSSQTSKTI